MVREGVTSGEKSGFDDPRTGAFVGKALHASHDTVSFSHCCRTFFAPMTHCTAGICTFDIRTVDPFALLAFALVSFAHLSFALLSYKPPPPPSLPSIKMGCSK